ncbi:MAG: heme ABC transporter substrate-binding protein IsdE [Vallitalea sp.]|jgi:iron complex transport system substrate-binding protein|nr:heme ABC transporter substrate-binding protein IsdE [Vallitalea sp.]
MSKSLIIKLSLFFISLTVTGCVNQSAEYKKQTVLAQESKIIATSHATLMIMDKLKIDLIAIPDTKKEIPKRYQGLQRIGTPMSPDAEAIAMLEPSDVIGPDTLIETIKPKYDAVGINATFIDLQSVEGLYNSIEIIGKKYGKQSEAKILIDDYNCTIDNYMKKIENSDKPKVLVLMGLPGAYIACTPNSYVGSLIELAGAENVIKIDTNENFVSWNTEELIKLDPDIILLTAHGLPDLAMEMFNKEFSTNDVWKNFRAVKEDKVYELNYDTFGMSATFEWENAFNDLTEIFYGDKPKSFLQEVKKDE